MKATHKVIKHKYTIRLLTFFLIVFLVLFFFISVKLSVLVVLILLGAWLSFMAYSSVESFEIPIKADPIAPFPDENLPPLFEHDPSEYHLINVSLLRHGDVILALGRLTNLGACKTFFRYLVDLAPSKPTINYTVFSIFDKNLKQVQDWRIVETPNQPGYLIQGVEDHRLFNNGDKVMSSGTFYTTKDRTKRNTLARPCLTEWDMSSSSPKIKSQMVVDVEGDKDEKNWGAFTDNQGRLRFIRNMSPYEVVEIEGNNVTQLVKTDTLPSSDLRGGRFVGRLDDKVYLGMCHSIRSIDRTYFMYFFIFSPEYPYTVTHITERLNLFNVGGREFQYPHSAVLLGDKVVMCVSVDDCQTYFVTTSLKTIMGAMNALTTNPFATELKIRD